MWVRTCLNCGHKQLARVPPHEYRTDVWKIVLCKKCKTPNLTRGKEEKDFVEDSMED